MKARAASAARARAVQALREILDDSSPATPLLARKSVGLPAQDADLMRQIVLGVLRNRSLLDHELAGICRTPLNRLTPDLRQILEVALYQIRFLDRVPPYAAVDEAVRAARRSGGEGAAKLVNAVLRNAIRRGPPVPAEEGLALAARLALEFSHPDFLVQRWLDRFGEATTRQILKSDNTGSPLDLMANPGKTTRDVLAAALSGQGIETAASPLVPLALSVRSGNPLKSPLFPAGHFSVQDIGSQALALLLPPAESLVDLAAAPGGKSFAALALGRVRRSIALDRSPLRLLRVLEARARLEISHALPVAGDMVSPPLPLAAFPLILLDAPCSGTGTLRKNPEIRYRVTPDAIERLSHGQEEALAAGAALLKPEGSLLYSTCSLELEENERVVERVLAREPDLERQDILAPEGLRSFVEGCRFRMLPGPDNDGFTAHLLRRKRLLVQPEK